MEVQLTPAARGEAHGLALIPAVPGRALRTKVRLTTIHGVALRTEVRLKAVHGRALRMAMRLTFILTPG